MLKVFYIVAHICVLFVMSIYYSFAFSMLVFHLHFTFLNIVKILNKKITLILNVNIHILAWKEPSPSSFILPSFVYLTKF